MNVKDYVDTIVKDAKNASCLMATVSSSAKNAALEQIARYLLSSKATLMSENEKDL